MEMKTYLNKTAPRQAFSKEPESLFLRTTKWIHDHSTLVKTSELGGLAIGASSAASLPWLLPHLGSWSFAIAAGGLLLSAISALAYTHLNIVAPLHHDMKKHAFKTGEVEGGRLHYMGDVPVLDLEYASHRQAGFAHGYLLAPNMRKLNGRFDWVMQTLPRLFGYAGRATPEMLPEVVKGIQQRLPPFLIQELMGMVEGYNQWVEEQGTSRNKKITFEELLLWQLMPDAVHFTPFLEGIPMGKLVPMVPAPTPACTSIISRDEEHGPILGRNMDWPSMGIAGEHSLVIRRMVGREIATAEVTVPGLLGTITGMNRFGLCLAMNICQGCTREVRGLPASIFNRLALEALTEAKEMHDLLKHFEVLGPYHLTVADKNEGLAVHFHQSENSENPHRFRSLANGAPVVVTNCRYEEEGPTAHRHYSQQREERVKELFAHAGQVVSGGNGQHHLISHALSMSYVNNFETTHTVIMQPRTRTMEVAFDNAYSGTAKKTVLDGAELFG